MRTLVLGCVALALLFQCACRPLAPSGVQLGSFTENGVAVELELQRENGDQATLVGAFKPTQEYFHLYSKDLPREGIAGVGRPTLLEVASPQVLQVAGDLTANVPAISFQIEGFDQPLSIYPDGPVTLRLPVVLPHASEQVIPARLSVTYMACSSKGVCLPPVLQKMIDVNVPSAETNR